MELKGFHQTISNIFPDEASTITMESLEVWRNFLKNRSSKLVSAPDLDAAKCIGYLKLAEALLSLASGKKLEASMLASEYYEALVCYNSMKDVLDAVEYKFSV